MPFFSNKALQTSLYETVYADIVDEASMYEGVFFYGACEEPS